MTCCDVRAGSLGMPNAQRAFQDLRVVGNRFPVFFQALEIHGDRVGRHRARFRERLAVEGQVHAEIDFKGGFG